MYEKPDNRYTQNQFTQILFVLTFVANPGLVCKRLGNKSRNW